MRKFGKFSNKCPPRWILALASNDFGTDKTPYFPAFRRLPERGWILARWAVSGRHKSCSRVGPSPKGHTGPAEEMFEAVNAGWMDLRVEGTEHVAGTTSARDVFAAAQKAVSA